ncbi:MAG: NUDIX domain-containing protein [Chthoniobacterales bacterium]
MPTLTRHLICAALLAAFLTAHADVDKPAGTILYAETPDGIEFLLADHTPPTDRGWASFGGHGEADETVAETAARETEEETHGYFSREQLLAAIGDQPPLTDGPYSFFVIKVDHVPIAEIANHPVPPGSPTYAERGPFAWIPLSQIKRFFDPATISFPLRIQPDLLPSNSHTDYVWPLWLHNLSVALESGAIPLPARNP